MWYPSPSQDQPATALLETIEPVDSGQAAEVKERTDSGKADFAQSAPAKSSPAKVDGPGSEYWLP